MRTSHWKLFPGFLMGLLVLLLVGCGVGSAHAVICGVHWGVWLALTLVFPVLALVLMGKGEKHPCLYVWSYLTNAVGAGVAFGVVLGVNQIPFRLESMLIALALPAGLALLMHLAFHLFRRPKAVAVTFTLLGIGAAIGSLWLLKRDVLVGFGAIFGFLFFLALPSSCGKLLSKAERVLERLAISGFGAYLVVLAGALIILLEDGDFLVEGLFDGIDISLDSIGPEQKRRQ